MAIPTAAFFVHHLETGGLERVVANVLKALDRSRFRPVLILQNRRGALLEELPADVEIRDLGGVRLRRAARPLARELEACGARVVYSGTRSTNVLAVRAAARLNPRPAVVVSEHTPIAVSLAARGRRPIYWLAMRWTYPRAARVAVPLMAVGEELRSVLRLPNLGIKELLNPVFDGESLEGAMTQEPEHWPEGKAPVFVAAGRVVPLKAYDVLIRALARTGAEARLVILGEGPERRPLEGLAADLGLAERVFLPGRVENPFCYFCRATAVVSASRWEGFGNTLVEAMACGTPVVATDCPFGPRGILEDGQAGILVPVDDEEALAEGMAKLASGGDLPRALVRRGLRRSRDFDIQSTVPAYADFFDELLAIQERRRDE